MQYLRCHNLITIKVMLQQATETAGRVAVTEELEECREILDNREDAGEGALQTSTRYTSASLLWP